MKWAHDFRHSIDSKTCLAYKILFFPSSSSSSSAVSHGYWAIAWKQLVIFPRSNSMAFGIFYVNFPTLGWMSKVNYVGNNYNLWCAFGVSCRTFMCFIWCEDFENFVLFFSIIHFRRTWRLVMGFLKKERYKYLPVIFDPMYPMYRVNVKEEKYQTERRIFFIKIIIFILHTTYTRL